MEENRKEAYRYDHYAMWEKYRDEKTDETDREYSISFEYNGQNDGEEYYGISTDEIVMGQHIKYLKDAVEYFRQKHGEDIKIHSIYVSHVSNVPTWYKIFRTIFKLKKYSIHFSGDHYFLFLSGNPEKDNPILEKAYKIMDGNFRKWNERTERKNRQV